MKTSSADLRVCHSFWFDSIEINDQAHKFCYSTVNRTKRRRSNTFYIGSMGLRWHEAYCFLWAPVCPGSLCQSEGNAGSTCILIMHWSIQACSMWLWQPICFREKRHKQLWQHDGLILSSYAALIDFFFWELKSSPCRLLVCNIINPTHDMCFSRTVKQNKMK